MPIVTRSDDKQFVMQAYRETLVVKKKNLLKQEVKYLSESQGQFVRIYPKGDQLEAVFSREPGYLLGESIWNHFQQPQDLIYCEEQPESNSILLVVVKNYSVYLDTIVPAHTLRSELLPLLTGKHHYHIYVYGSVPIADRIPSDEKQFVFPEEYIAKYVRLEEAVFADIDPEDEYKLLPLNLALKSSQLVSYTTAFASFIALIFVGLLAWWFVLPSANDTVSTMPFAKKTKDPYADFHHAMSTPDPHRQLVELAAALDSTFNLPGWKVQQVNFDGRQFKLQLVMDGGNYNELSRFAMQNHFEYEITTAGAELRQASHAPVRKTKKTIMQTKQILALMMDQLDQLLTSKAVKYENSYSHSGSKEARISIQFKDLSPEMLSMIGEEFDDLPVKLSAVNAEMKQGVLKGSIQLSVWGA